MHITSGDKFNCGFLSTKLEEGFDFFLGDIENDVLDVDFFLDFSGGNIMPSASPKPIPANMEERA